MNAIPRIRSAMLLSLLVTLPAAPAAKAASLRHADNLVLPAAEVVEDDLYAAGKIVDVQGTVNGDLIAAGQAVSVSGTVTGDVIAAAREVTISGRVGGTVRAAGNSITVAGEVAHDVVAGCGTLVVGPQARVGRDVLAGAGNSSFGGRIDRDVRVGSGSTAFSGRVGGIVYARAQTVGLSDGAVLEKDLLYTSENEVTKAAGARVGGKVERRALPAKDPGADIGKAIWGWIRGLVGFLIFGALLYLLFPAAGGRAVQALRTAPAPSLGLGLLLAFGIPLAAAFLLLLGIFVGGWWIALGALPIYCLALAAGYVFAATWTGSLVLTRSGRAAPAFGWALLTGLAILGIVTAIPFVGWLVGWAAAILGLGALALAWYRSRRTAATAVPAAT